MIVDGLPMKQLPRMLCLLAGPQPMLTHVDVARALELNDFNAWNALRRAERKGYVFRIGKRRCGARGRKATLYAMTDEGARAHYKRIQSLSSRLAQERIGNDVESSGD